MSIKILNGSRSTFYDLDTTYSNGNIVGRISWDQDNATAQVGLSTNVVLRMGQDDMWYVKNQTGASIPKGSIVYAAGTVGASGRILVAPYIANGTIAGRFILGIAAEAIADGADGYVIAKGKLRNFNTNSFAPGTVLWASPTTAGAFTSTEPSAPNIKAEIAFVIHQHTNNGVLAVRRSSGTKLSDDSQVEITSPATGQLLRYNSNRWENWSPNFLTAESDTLQTVTSRGSSTTTGATFGGNVGIGTTAPSTKLEVNGGLINVVTNNPDGILTEVFRTQIIGLTGTSNWRNSIYAAESTNPSQSIFKFSLANSQTTQTDVMTLLGTGNVGIGTTSPSRKLIVYDTDANVPTIGLRTDGSGTATGDGFDLQFASSNTFLFNRENGYIAFGTNDTERMRITSGGSLLIGDTTQAFSPTTQGYMLGVKSQASQAFISIAKSGQTLDSGGMVVGLDTTSGYIYVRENIDLSFGTNNTTQVVIKNSGNVGIGTSSPSEKLQVVGNINSTGGNNKIGFNTTDAFTANGGSTAHYGISYFGGANYVGVSGYFGLNFFSNGTERMRIDYSGNVGIGTTSPGAKLEVNGNIYQSSGILYSDHLTPFSGNQLQLLGGGANYLYINGNVGIGTTAPGSKLNVTNGFIRVNGTDTDQYFFEGVRTGVSTTLRIYDNSSIPFYDSHGTMIFRANQNGGSGGYIGLFGGNVGIGTAAPSSILHIDGIDPFVRINNVNSANNQGIKISYNYSDTHGFHLLYNANSAGSFIDNTYPITSGQPWGDIYFRQNNAGTMVTRMTIKADGGNVGIGTTGPATKLDVNGSINIANGNNLTWGGAYGAGIPTIASAINAGIYFYPAGSTSGATMHITSGGNVGIGTTAPMALLHVSGTVSYGGARFSPTSTDGESAISFYADVAGTSTITSWVVGQAGWGHTGDFVIGNENGGAGGNVRLLIERSGNVGIGTTSPASLLYVGAATNFVIAGRTASVVGSADSETILTVTRSGTDYPQMLDFGVNNGGLYSTISARQFTTNENRLVLQPNGGNVGIGTTSPSYKLQVQADGAGLYVSAASVSPFTQDIAVFRYGGNGNAVKIENQGGKAAIQARLDNGTAMDLSLNASGGNVGIGTTSPLGKLHVEGNSIIVNTENSNQAKVLYFRYSDGAAINSDTYLTFGTSGSPTERMRITSGGTLLVGGTETPTESAWLGTAVFGRNTYNKVIIGSLESTTTGAYVGGHNSALTAWADLNVAGTAVIFRTEQVERMRLASNGNFGIGTTTPSQKFHLQGSNLMATFQNSSTSADQYTQLEFIAGSRDAYIWLGNQNTTSWAGDGGLNIYTGTGNMDFWTAATQKMRLTASGNLGIGTTSPIDKLHIVGGVTSTSIADVLNGQVGSIQMGYDGSRGLIRTWFSSPIIYQAYNYQAWETIGSERMRITAGGNLLLGLTSDFGYLLSVNGTSYFQGAALFNNTVVARNATTAAALGQFSVMGAGEFMSTGTLAGYFWENRSGGVTSSSNWYGWYTTSGVIHLYNGSTNLISINGSTGAATFSNTVNVGYDSNNRSTIRLTSNAANRQAAIYFYGNNVESAVLGYEGGSEVVGGGIQGDFVIRNVLANKNIILATNAGNVGVGTTAPVSYAKLDVFGNAKFGDGSSSNVLYGGFGGAVVRQTAYQGYNILYAGGDFESVFLGGNNDQSNYYRNQLHYFQDRAGATRIFIASDGNVGIGTISPDTKLHIVSSEASVIKLISSGGDARINIGHSGNGGFIGYSNTGSTGNLFYVTTGAGTIGSGFVMDNNGNVGIGTASPTTKIDVRGNFLLKGDATDGGILTITRRYSTGAQTINFNNNHPTTNLDWTGARITSADAGSYNGYLDFAVSLGNNGSEVAGTAAVASVMRLTKDGNVGIGTTSPKDTLAVNGTIAKETTTGFDGTFDNFIKYGFKNDLEGTGQNLDRWIGADATITAGAAAANKLKFKVYSGGSTGSPIDVMTLDGAGNVGIGTTSPSAKLHVKGNAVDNIGLTVLENDYASGDIYYPTLSVINTRGNHSYGIVSEFRTNSAGDADRPSILFYSAQAAHSWQIGQGSPQWTQADSFNIGYRASNTPSTFPAWPTAYFTISTSGAATFSNSVTATSFIGPLTGNASTATNATNATNAVGASNLFLTSLGTGSVNVNNGSTAVYRNENGNGGNLSYAPVLHLGGGDTMWQIQGDYYDSSTLRWRAGYNGTWYAWRDIIHSGNIASQSVATATTAGALTSMNISQFTNNSGYLTAETDTLASVTGRGASTSSPITINGGGSQPLSLTTANSSPWHIALVRNDLGLTSRVFAHNSPYNGWYFEHNISISGNTNWHSGNDGDGSGLDADLLDGQQGSHYAQASLSNNKTYTSTGNAAGSFLGGHYSSGGAEKPNSGTFGAGKFKVAMLSGGNLGFGGAWNDVMWVSSYNGGDVKSSHALVFDKYSTNVWVSDQDFDSGSWGTGYLLLHSGNFNSYAPTLTGGGASGTWGINVTGYSTQLNGYAQQVVYTILDGPANGPVIKVRYDGATANRYIDFGYKDGFGTYYEGFKILNGDTPTWQGNTILHAGNFNSYALPLSGGVMTGKILAPSYGSDAYGGAFEIRERGYVLATQSDWSYSPAISFHWGNRFAVRLGFDASGFLAVDNVRFLNASNFNSYAPTLTGGGASGSWGISITGNAATATSAGNADTVDGFHASVAGTANTIPTRNASGYLIPENWIQLNGIYGLYSPTNNAHLRPNPNSYGPWLVTGTRNGWNGIEFDANNGQVNLMILPDSNLTGFHNNSYSWQFYWAAGALYLSKSNYGGGTIATVLDSSNYNSYAPTLTGAGASGTWGINVTGTSALTASSGFVTTQNWNSIIPTSALGLMEAVAYSGSNSPSPAYNYGVVLQGSGANASFQMYFPEQGGDTTRGLWYRSGYSGTFGTWKRVIEMDVAANTGTARGTAGTRFQVLSANGYNTAANTAFDIVGSDSAHNGGRLYGFRQKLENFGSSNADGVSLTTYGLQFQNPGTAEIFLSRIHNRNSIYTHQIGGNNLFMYPKTSGDTDFVVAFPKLASTGTVTIGMALSQDPSVVPSVDGFDQLWKIKYNSNVGGRATITQSSSVILETRVLNKTTSGAYAMSITDTGFAKTRVTTSTGGVSAHVTMPAGNSEIDGRMFVLELQSTSGASGITAIGNTSTSLIAANITNEGSVASGVGTATYMMMYSHAHGKWLVYSYFRTF